MGGLDSGDLTKLQSRCQLGLRSPEVLTTGVCVCVCVNVNFLYRTEVFKFEISSKISKEILQDDIENLDL